MSNSARRFKRAVHHFGLLLNIPVSSLVYQESGNTVVMPWLRPTSILTVLLEKHPWLLLGGLPPGDDAKKMASAFWQCYKLSHPSHKGLQHPEERLQMTVPLALHGDGARTLKKQPLEVVSLEAVWGLNSCDFEDQGDCGCKGPHSKVRVVSHSGNPAVQKVNSKFHSYLTKFLIFAFASKKYDKLPGLLKELLQQTSADLAQACEQGVVVKGQRFFFAVLGCKGDLEYHAKTGLLTRSYQNVGTVNAIPCCHLCEAGSANLFYEDMSPKAPWISTRFTSFPWSETPPFAPIPFEDWHADGGRAPLFFRHDPFHVFRLGIARNFIGSCLVLLASMGKFDDPDLPTKDIQKRLGLAWDHFRLWYESHGARPSGIKSFSKDKLHFPTKNSFPWVGCKGSDSVLLLRWLSFWLCLLMKEESLPEHKYLEQLMLRGAQAGLRFTVNIHRHSMWLVPSCVLQIVRSARGFCANYARLAQHCLTQGLVLFSMVPKIHAMLHFIADLQECLDKKIGYTLNISTFDCSMNEDFVGRIARQSRRISTKNAEDALIRVYLCKLKACIRKHKAKRA